MTQSIWGDGNPERVPWLCPADKLRAASANSFLTALCVAGLGLSEQGCDRARLA